MDSVSEAASNPGGDWLLDSQYTPLSLGQAQGQVLRVPRRRGICSDFGWSQPRGRTWGPPTTFMGSVPLLTILHLGCLRRISLEPGIVKSRSWKATGPTQAPFSTDEEMEPRALIMSLIMARALSSIPGGQPGNSSERSLPPCHALISTSLREPSGF